eukprot:3302227-Prymnesium_polylepis.1
MPPSIEANESGISSTETYSPERAAHASLAEMSMATIGVLFRKPEKRAVGPHSRSTATAWSLGWPRMGRMMRSTVRASSSARAIGKSAPIASTDGEQKPLSAA